VTCRSLMRRSPTECGVSEYDLETSMRGPGPAGGCLAMERNNSSIVIVILHNANKRDAR
jgi:hypothetical protein